MEAPKTIDLLGLTIEINVHDKRDDVWGEWDGEARSIFIHASAPEDYKRVTFLHEIIHGLDDILGLGINHRSVYALSQVLFAMMKDNPVLTLWLFDELLRRDDKDDRTHPTHRS